MLRPFSALASSLAIVLVLSACTAPTEETSPSEEASELAIVRMDQPDINSDLANTSVSGSVGTFEGTGGYTFAVTFTMAVTDVSSSATNAAPGRTDVAWSIPIAITATNTTAGRNSDWANMNNLSVSGWWPTSSPLCSGETVAENGRQLAYGTVGDFCWILFRNLQGASGAFDVGGTNSLTGDVVENVTADESSTQAIVADIANGPATWTVSNTSNSSVCDAIVWASNGSVPDCVPAGVVGAAPGFDADIDQALSRLGTLVEGKDEIADLSACPFAASPIDLVPGLAAESIQGDEWSSSYVAIQSDASADVTGASCNAGGMILTANNVSNVRDAEQYLANNGFDPMSNPASLYGGTVHVGPTSITPADDDSYEVMQFAWVADGLAIEGRLVRATPDQTLAWLRLNLNSIVNYLAQATIS
ncbi:hypothetical protein FB472_1232 [Rhodoglobus vestalii]|uniref:DUF3558 domain-containing protein n=1 Tax=Rhodoglobus vestalii TaxID=193384 RepID=A0A8H2K8K7_9MICO|nr:hypothetical protein [Rhodoglobus vestalii]TQO19661.1 hypothetical protein FB472_1232 [Rhodoglobus vestalii]